MALDLWPPAATLAGRSGDLGKIRAARSSLQHGIPPPGGLHGLQEGVAGSRGRGRGARAEEQMLLDEGRRRRSGDEVRRGRSGGARLPGRRGERRRVGSRGGLGWSLVGGIGSGGMRGSRGRKVGGWRRWMRWMGQGEKI